MLLLVVCTGCSAGRTATARPVRPKIPAGFLPEAFSAVSKTEFWLLGTGPCHCSLLVHTTNGGRSFTKIGAPPLPIEGTTPSLEFADARDGFAFVPDSRSPLYATHDAGSTWHRQPLGDALAVAIAGNTAYAVTAGCSAQRCVRFRLEKAPASSTAWRPASLPFVPDGALVALAARRSKVWLLGTPSGNRRAHDRLARSADSGRTFATGVGPCYSDLGGELSPASENVVWAFCPTGMLGGALRSANGGVSFAPLHTPALVNSARLAPASATTAVVFGNGAGSQLLRTTDGGVSWKPARVPHKPTAVSWLGFTDARVGYALVQIGWDAAAKVERQALWRTTDAGAHWVKLPIR
jgi:photosystem II stability/assembly factor-like uncharacterized protein